MAFRFKVQMVGLCHFVENGDQARACQVCVLLPDAPANVVSVRTHEPRLVYQSNFLQTPPSTPATEVTVESLKRQRVAFRSTPVAGAPPLAPDLRGKLVNVVKLEELVAATGPYIDFVNVPPASPIGAEVLLDQGTLAEEAVTGRWRWVKPTGEVEERGLPAFVSLTIGPVEQVEVVITPFEGGAPRVLAFASPAGEDVHIVITADCDLRSTLSLPAAVLQVDTPDEDFGAHYLFFQDLGVDAASRPVPLQLAATASEAAAFAAVSALPSRLRAKSRFVIKQRLALLPGMMPSGGGVEIEPRTAALVVNAAPTGAPGGGGGGGSDCQNGSSSVNPSFDLDGMLPVATRP